MNFDSLIFYSCWEGSPFRILKISDIPPWIPDDIPRIQSPKKPWLFSLDGWDTLQEKKHGFIGKTMGKTHEKPVKIFPKTNPYRPNPDSIPMFHHFSYSCSPWFMESIPRTTIDIHPGHPDPRRLCNPWPPPSEGCNPPGQDRQLPWSRKPPGVVAHRGKMCGEKNMVI